MKKLILFVVVVALAGGGFYYYKVRNARPEPTVTTSRCRAATSSRRSARPARSKR